MSYTANNLLQLQAELIDMRIDARIHTMVTDINQNLIDQLMVLRTDLSNDINSLRADLRYDISSLRYDVNFLKASSIAIQRHSDLRQNAKNLHYPDIIDYIFKTIWIFGGTAILASMPFLTALIHAFKTIL